MIKNTLGRRKATSSFFISCIIWSK